MRALDELRAALTESDNLLIYYAGHGVLERDSGEGYWLPVDAEEDSQANWAELSSGEEVAALSAPEPEPYHGKLQAQVTLRCQPSADACMAIFGEKDGLILSFEGPLRVHQGEVVEASRVVSVPEAKMKVFITEGTVDSQRFTLRGTIIGKVTTDGTSLEPRQFDASGEMTEGRFTGSFLTAKTGGSWDAVVIELRLQPLS